MAEWNIREGRKIDGLIELVDLAPTLLEAAGLEIPNRMQGKSLLSLLKGGGESDFCREQVYSEYYNSWTHGDAYGTMLRTPDEKIVVFHGTQQGEFYDLKNDPEEFFNLWNDPSAEKRKTNCSLDALMLQSLRWTLILRDLGPFEFFSF